VEQAKIMEQVEPRSSGFLGRTHSLARSRKTGWVLVIPALLVVAFVLVYPVVQTIFLSFGETELSGGSTFVGLKNFQRLLKTPRFWTALTNTLLFTAVTVPIELVIGIGLAVMLNKAFYGRGIVRLAVLFPWALPTALNALMWRWMYNTDFGIFNALLIQSGFVNESLNWLGRIPLAMISMMIVSIWKTSSFMALILLAGLQAIPDELYEAGIVDGTSGWSAFWHITLPLLRSTIMVALLLRSMDALRAFELPFNLTDGGPVTSTETLSLYAYKNLFQYVDFNFGASVVILQFIIILTLSLVYVRSIKRGETLW
jgi:multiple sugar transport system permease protein